MAQDIGLTAVIETEVDESSIKRETDKIEKRVREKSKKLQRLHDIETKSPSKDKRADETRKRRVRKAKKGVDLARRGLGTAINPPGPKDILKKAAKDDGLPTSLPSLPKLPIPGRGNPDGVPDGAMGENPDGSDGSGGTIGTTADEPDNMMGVLQAQLGVQEEILEILQKWDATGGPGGDDGMKKPPRSRNGGGGGGGGLGGILGLLGLGAGVIGGGLVIEGADKLQDAAERFEDFEWPEIPPIPPKDDPEKKPGQTPTTEPTPDVPPNPFREPEGGPAPGPDPAPGPGDDPTRVPDAPPKPGPLSIPEQTPDPAEDPSIPEHDPSPDPNGSPNRTPGYVTGKNWEEPDPSGNSGDSGLSINPKAGAMAGGAGIAAMLGGKAASMGGSFLGNFGGGSPTGGAGISAIPSQIAANFLGNNDDARERYVGNETGGSLQTAGMSTGYLQKMAQQNMGGRQNEDGWRQGAQGRHNQYSQGNRASEKNDRQQGMDVTVDQTINVDPSDLREMRDQVQRDVDNAMSDLERQLKNRIGF